MASRKQRLRRLRQAKQAGVPWTPPRAELGQNSSALQSSSPAQAKKRWCDSPGAGLTEATEVSGGGILMALEWTALPLAWKGALPVAAAASAPADKQEAAARNAKKR